MTHIKINHLESNCLDSAYHRHVCHQSAKKTKELRLTDIGINDGGGKFPKLQRIWGLVNGGMVKDFSNNIMKGAWLAMA